jgi:hypothetical protein
MDYTAKGYTVGLAARVEQMANPGKTLLTRHTAKLVSGYFALRDLGSTRIKGLNDPLQLFDARIPCLGEHSRFKRRVEVKVPYRTLVRPNKARPFYGPAGRIMPLPCYAQCTSGSYQR